MVVVTNRTGKQYRRWRSFFWPSLCMILIVRELLNASIGDYDVSLLLCMDTNTTSSASPADHAANTGQQQEPRQQSYSDLSRGSSLGDGTVDLDVYDRSPSTYVSTKKAEALLQEPIEVVRELASKWRHDLPLHMSRATYHEKMYEHSHDRFFPFDPLTSCKKVEEVGRKPDARPGRFDDDSKWICGLDSPVFQEEGCIIYSIGSNNEFGFERALLNRTVCDIHTFDCTGLSTRFTMKPDTPRSHFHHVCLSHEYAPRPKLACMDDQQICGEMKTLPQLQKQLNHTSIALLKIDVEGFEVPLFRSWWVGNETVYMPTQILAELHYNTLKDFAAQIGSEWRKKYKFDHSNRIGLIQNAAELLQLNQFLMEMGYIVTYKENNRFCRSCTEVTLVRVPPSVLFEKKHYQLDSR